MSDIYATAMREAAKSPEQRKEEAEERASRLSMTRSLVIVLSEACPAWKIKQVGGGNSLSIETCGREYHMAVLGGVKRG